MYKFIYSKVFSLAFALICASSLHAFEIRPFAEFMFPSTITIKKEVKDVDMEKEWDTDFVLKGGAEFLFKAEFAPLRYGLGLAYKTEQKQDDQVATPASVPFWLSLSVGSFNSDNLFSPYIAGRFGTLAPLTGNGNWWERPLNFFGNFGIGVVFPYNIGLEVNYDYSSMLKSFESSDMRFRVFSGRIGIQLSWGLELFHDRKYKSDEEKQEEKGSTPAKENPAADSSGYLAMPEETAEDSTSDSTETTDNTYAPAADTATATDSSITDTAATAPDTVAQETVPDTVAATEPDTVAADSAQVAEEKPAEVKKTKTKKKASKKASKKKSKAKSKKSQKSSKKKKSKRR